jgi:hypothetical protein
MASGAPTTINLDLPTAHAASRSFLLSDVTFTGPTSTSVPRRITDFLPLRHVPSGEDDTYDDK